MKTQITVAVKSCFQFGDFTLSSGKKSPYYIDLRRLMMNAYGLDLVGNLLVKAISPFCAEFVGGMATAAIPVVTSVLMHNRSMFGFYVRENAKLHGLQHQIEGHLRKDSRVVIVDDVATSGGSIAKAVEIVARDYNCKVMGAACILDRQEGAGGMLAQMGVPLVALTTLKEVLCSDE